MNELQVHEPSKSQHKKDVNHLDNGFGSRGKKKESIGLAETWELLLGHEQCFSVIESRYSG